MGQPVARVGSLTKKGDTVISGVPTHLVGGSGAASVTVEFDGQVVVFDADDASTFGNDDPEGVGGRQYDPNAPNTPPPGGSDYAPAGTDNAPTPVTIGCSDITGTVTGNYSLSQHFTLAQVSTRTPAGSHQLRAQGGRSIQQIICNLKALAVNCLEPIYSHFNGKIIIGSGFRGGNSGSQHEKGMAADIYLPGFDAEQMFQAAIWIRDNIPYDQMILERSAKSGSRWIHVSFNRETGKQRRKVTTCGNAGANPETYENGLRKV